jgi:hypothetical protein
MQRIRNRIFLGAFVLSLLGTIVFGEDTASAPVSVYTTTIRIVDDAESSHFGSFEFALRPEVSEKTLALSQKDFQRVFPVWVGEDDENLKVLGTHSVDGLVVRFVPRYSIEPNLVHTARVAFRSMHGLRGLKGEALPDVEIRMSLQREPAEPTTVVSAVFPSGDVPENLLRFYIHFSAPMSRGGVYEHVYLIDSNGVRVEKAFLELEPELWDADTRWLTLLFDPGRIKRGLKPRSDLGSALKAGGRYTLVIDKALEDAQGTTLAAASEKAFSVQEVDRVSPDPDQWIIRSPRTGSQDTLFVSLDEPIDRALLKRMLSVVDSDGEHVGGEAFVADGEKYWSFIPDGMWKSGVFSVRADVRLEDRAGNRLDMLFDQEIGDQEQEGPSPDPFVSLSFVVK